jgi:hypothetical protein
MVKIVVNVTNKELDSMENLAVVWNLCDKHKAVINATEEEMFSFTQKCKVCKELNRELSRKVLHVWSKMMTAYLDAKKKKKKILCKK